MFTLVTHNIPEVAINMVDTGACLADWFSAIAILQQALKHERTR